MKEGPPHRAAKPRPYALLFPGYRHLSLEDQYGTTTADNPYAVSELLERYKGHELYVTGGLSSIRHTTGALSWEASVWRGRTTRMTHTSGASVTSLRGSVMTLQALTEGLDWLHGHGIAPRSITSMAWALWRSTLPGEVSLSSDPRISRQALFGGRQEIREARTYRHMVSADIVAAYPYSMAQRPYAGSLRRVSPATILDPHSAGMARATVYVDREAPFYPLPRRIAADVIQFAYGRVDGIWPWCELAAVKDLGFPVEVAECWAPAVELDLFSRWWELVQEGRNLPLGGRLIKTVSNALWGIFGMRGTDRSLLRWTDDTGEESYEIPLEERKMPHARTAHIAAETASRVRTRLLLDALYAGGTGRPVHVDTDGIIVRKRSMLPGKPRMGPGGWRVKARMKRIEIRAPQVYRYECDKLCGVTHAPWHYVTAGVPPSMAPEIFRRMPTGRHSDDPCRVPGYRGIDIVLAPGNAYEDTSEDVREARTLVGSMFGGR